MSTYAKAWAFNGVWAAIFLVLLSSFLTESQPALLAGMLGYGLMAFFAQSFPKCPHCREPVNMPFERDGWVGLSYGYVILPDRPRRECGYCGNDLTGNTGAE